MPAVGDERLIGSTMYVNEANTNLQVVPMQFAVRYYYYWAIWNYNPSNGFGSIYYYKNEPVPKRDQLGAILRNVG